MSEVTDVTPSRRMRAVVQRVAAASVSADGEVVSSISKGLVLLLGIGNDDKPADSEYIAKKILSLRVFDGADGAMWRQSVKDIAGDVLCVSQFTLLANTAKGSKPDFHRAMGSEQSREMYAAFLQRMRELYRPDTIKDGKFGAMMSVSLTNDGPVTFTLDSRKFEYVQSSDGNTKPVKSPKETPNGVGAEGKESGGL
ncbi:D-Tyr tRNAtyr deacylase-like domain-containing protein [Gautieria morchelliformis]|nr:D-Tyr tRNAtyr deacylase-like domain-containing protein [Gautieria morchelliformis]